SFEPGSSYNTLQHVSATGSYAGAYIRSGSHHNKILSSQFNANTMMNPLDAISNNDAGAFGILLHGDDNEIAYNEFIGNDACSYDYGHDGGAIEVYGGQSNFIHHNRAFNNNNFSELGNPRSRDNIYAYNLIYSPLSWSSFLTTRGANSQYGPIFGTKLYNNTVYLSGADSQGIVCHAGCSPELLKMRNNIIYAVKKAGFADNPFDDGHNIYWGGRPELTLGVQSLVVDPQFVDPAAQDFHLQLTSPAINTGTDEVISLGYDRDLDGVPIPVAPVVDRGAFTYVAASASSSTSQLPAANPVPSTLDQ
ncbi:MAG: hypothetical protein L0287_26075, partial [Anaerolineae bacterium]|nr:hypothetical protein [Anaerolineae bacterium]